MKAPSEPIVWYCPDLYGGIFLTKKAINLLCTELGLIVSNWNYITETVTIVKDSKYIRNTNENNCAEIKRNKLYLNKGY